MAADGPGRPNYQESLRALGALIDAWGVTSARIWLAPDGVRVAVPTRFGERRYPWAQLARVAEARGRLRGQRVAPTRPPAGRWEVVLRLVGRGMDAAAGDVFLIEGVLGGAGRPARVTVDSPAGAVLTSEDLVLLQLEHARRYWQRGRRG